MDLIDRDELKAACLAAHKGETGNALRLVCDTYRLICEAPSVNQWIPVEERLPEVEQGEVESEIVVFVSEYRLLNLKTGDYNGLVFNNYYIGVYSQEDGKWQGSDSVGYAFPESGCEDVVAWMPIPKLSGKII